MKFVGDTSAAYDESGNGEKGAKESLDDHMIFWWFASQIPYSQKHKCRE